MNCLQNSEEYNHELKYIITLDGGTTNTRAYLWKQDGSFVSSKKEEQVSGIPLWMDLIR